MPEAEILAREAALQLEVVLLVAWACEVARACVHITLRQLPGFMEKFEMSIAPEAPRAESLMSTWTGLGTTLCTVYTVCALIEKTTLEPVETTSS